MEYKNIKEKLLTDKDFLNSIFKFIKNKEREEFNNCIKKSPVVKTTNDNSIMN